MRYQLPADTPVTWSSPAEIRVGGSHTGRLFPDHPAVHAMLASLKLGTDEAFLRILAKSHGPDRARVDKTVLGLLEISVPVRTPTVGKRRVLVRTVPTSVAFAQLIAREFARRHHHVDVVGTDYQQTLPQVDLAIEVGEFVIPTRRYLPLLSADVPHLAVVRDIAGLQLGPFVVPGVTPCLRCDDLETLAAHPDWPAVATQLVNSAPVTYPPEIEWLGALQVGLLGARFLTRDDTIPPLGFVKQLIDQKTGEVRLVQRSFHAGCGCQALQDIATERPPLVDRKAAGIDAHV